MLQSQKAHNGVEKSIDKLFEVEFKVKVVIAFSIFITQLTFHQKSPKIHSVNSPSDH